MIRLRCLALLCLLGTFAIPKLQVQRPTYDVLAVLDITGSMNTRDQILDGAPVSRLQMEKQAIQHLLAALPCGSRAGVAIFVESRPFLLFEPMETCDNYAPLQASVAGISWRMGWDSESHIAEGLHAAILVARDLGADLIFLTDGQEVPPMAWSAPPDFSALRGAVHGLVVGVGGHDFVPIPKFDKAGREIGVWKPGEVPSETGGLFKGHEHLTAVDEPHLRTLAAQSGLTYHHLDKLGDVLPALSAAAAPRIAKTQMDIRFIPACAALLLLAAAFIPRRMHGAGQIPYRATGGGNQKSFGSFLQKRTGLPSTDQIDTGNRQQQEHQKHHDGYKKADFRDARGGGGNPAKSQKPGNDRDQSEQKRIA